MGRRSRWGAVFSGAAVLAAVLLAPPAASKVSGSEVVNELVGSISDGNGTALSLEESSAGDPQVTTDPTEDYEHVSGEPPQYTQPHFDIVELVAAGTIAAGNEFATVFPSDAGPVWCSEGGPAPPPDVTILCPRGRSPTSFGSGATILEIQTAAPIPTDPPARCGYAIWAMDPDGPAPFKAPQGDADAGNGFNLGWAAFFEPGSGWLPFRFTDPSSNGFQSTVDDGPFVAIAGDQISFWIPTDQASGVTEINGWAFCLEEGTDTSAQNSGSDQTGRTSFDAGALPTFELAFPAETLSPSPSPSPSTSPSPVSVSAVPPVGTESGSSRQTLFEIVIAIGGVTFLIGGYLYWRRREGPKDPLTAPSSVAPTTDRPDDRAFCDWALYVETPKGKVPVRRANGRECCVYRIRVGTELVSEERKAQGRQEPDAAEDPQDRLQVPSLVAENLALNLSAEVTARSGPAGQPGWMQALGAPSEIGPAGEHRQTPANADPPEVASHFQMEVNHTVRIALESMCPGHVNTFTASGSADLAANASMECTNSGPPECPVELTASGSVDVRAEGFLEFHVEHKMRSDPDEPEDLLVPGVLVHALTDLHDHRERDRGDYAGGDAGSDHATREGNAFELSMNQNLSVDAGILVPRAVWPTTDRVTAHAGTTIRTALEIDAEMRRVDCLDGGGCCGLPECRCEPKFTLRFDPIDAALFVDGEHVGLFPPGKKLGSNEPWELR